MAQLTELREDLNVLLLPLEIELAEVAEAAEKLEGRLRRLGGA